jgi:hypothetical protein
MLLDIAIISGNSRDSATGRAMTNKVPKLRRETFRTSLPGIRAIPDPTRVYSTFEWFLLDSISENLLRYNHSNGQFSPVLAESWSISGDQVVFRLTKNAKFNDGSPVTADDVVASFNRVINLKQSTHFEIWKYVKDLKAEGPFTVSFSYVGSKESLFLFLSSPESSIWSKADLATEPFSPMRFSGFYAVQRTTERGLILTRNNHSVRSKDFSAAPGAVEIIGTLSRWKTLEAIKNNEVDAFIGDYIPFSTLTDPHPQLEFLKSIPVVFTYLLNMTNKPGGPFSADLLSGIWKLQDKNGALTPAHSILPPGMEGSLTKTETLAAISEGFSSERKEISVGAPAAYFTEDYLKNLSAVAGRAGLTIRFHTLDNAAFFAVLEDPKKADFEYLMVGYVASDKFPFTQLKLITGVRNIHVDTPPDDAPSKEKLERLRKIQTDFLRQQLVVPFFYAPSVIVYRADLDIGNQPTTDAELQFWRINENLKNNYP